MQYARVCIEFDSSSAFREEINMEDDEGFCYTQKVYYDWQPPRCEVCNIFGHTKEVCSGHSNLDSGSVDAPKNGAKQIWVPVATVVPICGGSSDSPVTVAEADDLSNPPPVIPRPAATPSDLNVSVVPAQEPLTVYPSCCPRQNPQALRGKTARVSSSRYASTVSAPSSFLTPNRFSSLSVATCVADSQCGPPPSSIPLLASVPIAKTPLVPIPSAPVVETCPSQSGPTPCSSEPVVNLRPRASLCLSSSLRKSSLSVTQPLTHSIPPSRLPTPTTPVSSLLLNRYSSARSAATCSFYADVAACPSPSSPLSSPPSLTDPPSSPLLLPEPNPPSLPPIPSISPVSVGDDSLDPSDPLLKLDKRDDLGSDYEDNLKAPLDDPIYRAKMRLLESSDSEEDPNPESILNCRTRFHWEDNSSPRLFRKTPRRS